VELEQIQAAGAHTLDNSCGVIEDMLAGKYMAQFIVWGGRPFKVLRGYLTGSNNVGSGIVFNQRAQQAITVAVPISPSTIEEITPQLKGGLQGFERLPVIRARPTTHTPQAMTNLAHHEIRSAKFSVSHNFSLPQLVTASDLIPRFYHRRSVGQSAHYNSMHGMDNSLLAALKA
jgi:hypothetical protein